MDNSSLPPFADRENLSNLEALFHAEYGRALASWAMVEQSFSTLFCRVCEFDPEESLGPAIFFSGRSFQTRAALVGAACRNAGLDGDIQEIIRAALKKARQFETARNKIAHGYPTHIIFEGVDWQGWRIKEGENAKKPGGIGYMNLKSANLCFYELARMVDRIKVLITARERGYFPPAEEYLGPIRELPNDALRLEEDLTAEGALSPYRER
jgi:hypothetical protein